MKWQSFFVGTMLRALITLNSAKASNLKAFMQVVSR